MIYRGLRANASIAKSPVAGSKMSRDQISVDSFFQKLISLFSPNNIRSPNFNTWYEEVQLFRADVVKTFQLLELFLSLFYLFVLELTDINESVFEGHNNTQET